MSDAIHLSLPASLEHLNVLSAAIGALLEHVADLIEPETQLYNVQLAVQEVAVNVVKHAYAGNAEGRLEIGLALTGSPPQLVIDLRDTGAPFEPQLAAPPEPEQLQEGGYGLFLIWALLDEVVYRTAAGENHWRLVKNLAQRSTHGDLGH